MYEHPTWKYERKTALFLSKNQRKKRKIAKIMGENFFCVFVEEDEKKKF